jgi:hypothetical protein
MTDSVNKDKIDTVSTVSEGLNVNNDQQKEKQKRRFKWTPARKAAFDKCVAARKKGIENKTKMEDPKKDDTVKDTTEVIASADSSISKKMVVGNSSSSRSELLQKKTKRNDVSFSSSESSSSESSSESVEIPLKTISKKNRSYHKLEKEIRDLKKHVKKAITKPKVYKRIRKYEKSISTSDDDDDEVDEKEEEEPIISKRKSSTVRNYSTKQPLPYIFL